MWAPRLWRRSLRGKDRPAPTQCLQTQCFDPLVRNCVACSLLRTTGPRLGKSRAAPTHGARARASPSSGPPPPHTPLPSAPCSPCPSPPAGDPSSLAPGTALQPQESAGPGTPAEAEAALPLPALLFGAPALLGLALALALLGLVTWKRRRRQPGAASLDVDTTLSPGTLDATAPIWLLPSEDPAATPPTHSVPVPATELGSTELVTTKTAGPELQ
uniref:TNF receptor superfamily member 13C n=1 Tax=Bos indicus x Bos taurus TaxID=30522 RepID=A0A4W2F7S8_BOBOX